MGIKYWLGFFVIILLMGNGGFMQGISEAASDRCIHVVNAIQYSNDPDKLLFRYRCGGPYNPDFWAVYEFSSGRAYDLDILHTATKNAIHDSPSYSRDGKLITFVAGQDNHRNIFVMNAGGSNLRQLTHDYNENPGENGKNVVAMRLNATPSFSPDGKRVIFKRSAMKRQKPEYKYDPLLPSRWDIYEIDIETGKERKLTNYEFYQISKPFYLSDGKQFIYSAEFSINASPQESGIDRKKRDKYWDQYRWNTIFIMDGVNNELKPILKNGRYSGEPQIAREGVVVFLSDVTDMDGIARTGTIYYDLFVFDKGRNKRLIGGPLSGLRFTVSPDGNHVVFSYSKPGSVGLSIINLDGTGRRVIDIPWQGLKMQTVQSDGKKQ
jgi:Tol biopolymer transport system component